KVTDEATWWNRREIVRALGLTGAATLIGGCGLAVQGDPFGDTDAPDSPYAGRFPYPRNEEYKVPERALTDPITPLQYNNFYEFTISKERVHKLVGNFVIDPWTVAIDGLCRNKGAFHLEDILDRFDDVTQERIYRFRCVETWAMTVPWTGFPLADLVRWADPLPEAKYIRFTSASRPTQMPGVDSDRRSPWPYTEGLTIDEAMNEVALLATGIYGQAMPKQNGAPIRLIVPWKYGYKSIKSIERIEFVSEQPKTFWNTIVPEEYGFESNIDPDEPHRRWSQEFEHLIPGKEKIRTLLYNGYGEYVSHLYRS
ncbi:MAG: sulfoxide reductase catalytic subunit YedY, partial [Kiritimatiellia bacterium]